MYVVLHWDSYGSRNNGWSSFFINLVTSFLLINDGSHLLLYHHMAICCHWFTAFRCWYTVCNEHKLWWLLNNVSSKICKDIIGTGITCSTTARFFLLPNSMEVHFLFQTPDCWVVKMFFSFWKVKAVLWIDWRYCFILCYEGREEEFHPT